MPNRDLLLYVVHAGFWASFGVARALLHARAGGPEQGGGVAPVAPAGATARFSRTLVAVHMVAFGVMYFGIGNAVIAGRVPEYFPGQRLVGLGVISAGAALVCWALTCFQSWRFRAKLDSGHQLATGGPFQFLRHPIYMGLNLLAVGTALWVPTPTMWAAAGLMVFGSDLRGRAEEALLTTAFGAEYLTYCARTRRFVPGVY